jgi:hypothetical protein
MVAAVQLSPADASRIALLFKGDRSIFTVADATRKPLAELLQWLALPHIQAVIECVTRLENEAHRAAAITALRQTMEATKDLLEKRRAACAIIRAIAPQRTGPALRAPQSYAPSSNSRMHAQASPSQTTPAHAACAQPPSREQSAAIPAPLPAPHSNNHHSVRGPDLQIHEAISPRQGPLASLLNSAGGTRARHLHRNNPRHSLDGLPAGP